ncbi:MAG: hypothetical protein ABIR84_04950, partial [Candidatus Nitrotoga sp.]
MSALLESLQTAFADNAQSKVALDQAINTGLPSQRSEQWKYTSLRPLSARRFVAPATSLPTLDAITTKAIACL